MHPDFDFFPFKVSRSKDQTKKKEYSTRNVNILIILVNCVIINHFSWTFPALFARLYYVNVSCLLLIFIVQLSLTQKKKRRKKNPINSWRR